MTQQDTPISIVYYYRVDISDNTGILKDKSEFKSAILNVIAENENFIVVNDPTFTTVSKKKCEYREDLIKSGISLYANDKVWGNRISYSRYSLTPVKASKIRKEIEDAISKKYGYFTGVIDLSIITEKATQQPTTGE